MKAKALKCTLLALALAVTSGCGTGNVPVGTSGGTTMTEPVQTTGDATAVSEKETAECLDIILDYDWMNADGQLISKENEDMNGPFISITLSDLNSDEIPEVILSQTYTSRTVQINDVYSIINNSMTYVGSFFGGIKDNKIFFNKESGKFLFYGEADTFQNMTDTNTVFVCSYNEDLSDFNCFPLASVNLKDDIKEYREYAAFSFDQNCVYDFSCWSFGANEMFYSATKAVTAEAYEKLMFEFKAALEEMYTLKMATSEKLVFNRFENTDYDGSENWASSKEETENELKRIYDEYFDG